MAYKIAGGVEGVHAVIMRPVARRAELASDFNEIRCAKIIEFFYEKGRPLYAR